MLRNKSIFLTHFIWWMSRISWQTHIKVKYRLKKCLVVIPHAYSLIWFVFIRWNSFLIMLDDNFYSNSISKTLYRVITWYELKAQHSYRVTIVLWWQGCNIKLCLEFLSYRARRQFYNNNFLKHVEHMQVRLVISYVFQSWI